MLRLRPSALGGAESDPVLRYVRPGCAPAVLRHLQNTRGRVAVLALPGARAGVPEEGDAQESDTQAEVAGGGLHRRRRHKVRALPCQEGRLQEVKGRRVVPRGLRRVEQNPNRGRGHDRLDWQRQGCPPRDEEHGNFSRRISPSPRVHLPTDPSLSFDL